MSEQSRKQRIMANYFGISKAVLVEARNSWPQVKGAKINGLSSDMETIWIVTAYYPAPDKWHEDLRTRKES